MYNFENHIRKLYSSSENHTGIKCILFQKIHATTHGPVTEGNFRLFENLTQTI